MGKAVWDPRNGDDIEVFKVLRRHFHGCESGEAKQAAPSPPAAGQKPAKAAEAQGAGALAQAGRAWRGLKQLGAQKTELLRETASVLARIGRLDGSVKNYASFGDNGKMVLNFARDLKINGNVYLRRR